MQREKIREQLSVLEERLEQLEYFFASEDSPIPAKISHFNETKETFKALQGLVDDEELSRRSISTDHFVRKIIPFLISESSSKGYEINIGYYAEGKISLEMVELSMNAILSCIRASLKCYQGMTRAYRMQKKLFIPYSFFLDVRANADEISFALVDDGLGYKANFKAEFDSEKQFRSMRNHLAQHDGWFGSQTMANYGGLIQFRIPQQRARFDCLLLQNDDCETLLPASCVVETITDFTAQNIVAGQKYFSLQENGGLLPLDFAKFKNEKLIAIKVGAADFQFWIACKNINEVVKARRMPAMDFLEEGAWFSNFGIFLRSNKEVLMPLVDGSVLMNFYQKWSEE